MQEVGVENANFGNIWRQQAELHPDQTALIQGDDTLTWGDWLDRSTRLAGSFAEVGLKPGDHVGVALRNGFEIFEVYFACFLAGFVPVNTNYRYEADELRYVWDNADVRLAVFDSDMDERVEKAKPGLPGVVGWVSAERGTGAVPPWALGFDVCRHGERPADLPTRGGDDIFLLYTGGTTGMPKGAVWRQGDFFRVLHGTSRRKGKSSQGEAGGQRSEGGDRPVAVVGPPLIHGTGMAIAWGALDEGGTVVLLPDGRFDADEMVGAISRHRASIVAIVGDAFGVPLAASLERNGDKDVSSLRRIVSSGAIWSPKNKAALAAAVPSARLVDMFGSSETVGVGRSVWNGGGKEGPPQFTVGKNIRILTEDGGVSPVLPGVSGRIAVGGPTALGYYKDSELSEKRFVEADGERWFVTGDMVSVDDGGSLRFLGRGNMCINTGGEKVYPEEVEVAIKAVDGVVDVGVVGAVDERYGEVVCAVVDVGDVEVDVTTIPRQIRGTLAGYKIPKYVFEGTVFRLANGKLDYSKLKQWVAAQVAEVV